ncbi:MAG: filamentous hemagglutinin N-terminal domain-containing protein [Phycisphaerales bacterium]|nr:filamentous hemagglutinin N-terminal domain-containing protein [Phycisphaerales bacterium]
MSIQTQNQSWRQFTTTAIVSLAICYGSALAAPEGGDVTEGDADIDYGDWTRVVTGEITVIEWLSFQIAAGETVEFIMPNENSRVLNLIQSGVPTEIMGTILGNGQVFLVNPSGVIFGQGAVVNVGAMYAAAGNISTSDFMSGVYRFSDARGVVENRGHLQGDLIALIGGRVANHGTISAPGGTVIMAAGEQILIGEHLGHIFVELEKPTDLANTDHLNTDGFEGLDLASGDVFSLAAWNTGTIDAAHTTVAVSSGHSSIDHSISAQDITLIAQGDSYIELSSDLHSTGDGIFIDGDLVLAADVTMTSKGDQGHVQFNGTVDSSDNDEHNLIIEAGTGYVELNDAVGESNEASRLGVLDVTANQVSISSNIAVNQEMNFYAPVEIRGNSTVFDVGEGSALFGDDIFSSTNGLSDVAFLYSGDAWVGSGEARTPFQFRGGIGVGPTLSSNPSSGIFRNIQFGDDLSGPSRSSAFVFGTGLMSGTELGDASLMDLSRMFQVSARESIVMGNGQKMLSFGSLGLSAKGNGETLVEVGDINVLGDLSITSIGRQGGIIRILDRQSGEVDFSGNESDRDGDGLIDQNTELIASGSITLDGELVFDADVTLGASEVFLLNNSGLGEGAGLDIDLFPGGVSIDLFRSILAGSEGLLYPYDLALPATFGPEDSEADLATSFLTERDTEIRHDDPYLAAREVLQELTLNPRNPSIATTRSGTRSGVHKYDEAGAATFGITIDRLSQKSVRRLTNSYVALLGNRSSLDTNARENDQLIKQQIGWLWILSNQQEMESIQQFTNEHAPENLTSILKIKMVLNAISLLELTPLEIQRAQQAFLMRVKPEQMPLESLYKWFAQ